MEKTEQSLVDCTTKLTSQLASVEKVDKFGGDLGAVQTNVDLAMTPIHLVQQEQVQVQVSKLLKTSTMGTVASDSGIMGAPPGSSSSGSAGASAQPPLSHLSPSLLRTAQVNPTQSHPAIGSDTPTTDTDRQEPRRQWLPKMDFPHFDGSDARIWVDKCISHFAMYQILVGFRVSVASIHMSGPAAQWFQTFKQRPGSYN
jgi:hypothetical protein